jgi:hypothetical protein
MFYWANPEGDKYFSRYDDRYDDRYDFTLILDMMIDLWPAILQYWPRKEAPRLSGIEYSQKKIWLILSRRKFSVEQLIALRAGI